MPSSKWRSERSGPNWLMDEQGRLIGYRDEAGNEYKLPSEPVSGGINDNDEPSSSVSGDGMRIVGASKIRRLLSALPQAAYRRVYLAVHGHSIPAGAYCDDAGTLDAAYHVKARSQSFPAHIARRLAAAFGGTGLCAGEPMSGITAGAINPLFTLGGTAAFAQGSLAGPAYGSWITLSGTGRTMSFTAVGTSFKVWALSNNANARARWSAPSVAGGAIQSVATGPQGAAPATVSALFWYEYVVTGVTPGETVTLHTPVVPSDPTSAIPYYIDLDWRPTEPGVTVYRMSSSGQPLVAMHAAAMDSTDITGPVGWQGAAANNVSARLNQAQSMSTRHALDGVILQSDVNDLNTWNAATGLNYGYTLADHQRHLSNYLDYHASINLDVLVLLGPIRDPAFAASNRPYDQADLIAAYKAVIASKANAAYIDWTENFKGSTLADRYAAQSTLMADIVHPGKMGHALWGMGTAAAMLAAPVA